MKRLLILLAFIFSQVCISFAQQCTEETPCPQLARLGAGLGGGVPAGAAPVAIAYDNAASASSAANVNNLSTGSFAVAGGSGSYLVVGVASGAGTAVDPTGCKWGGSGGTAMSKIGSTLTLSANFKVSLYGLADPTGQTSTVYCNWPSNQDETMVGAVSLIGVSSVGTAATATGNCASSMVTTVTATTTAGDIVVDVIFIGDNTGGSRTITADGSQVARVDIDGGTPTQYEAFGMSTETAAGVSTAMTWTVSGSVAAGVTWAAFALPLHD